MNKRGWIHILEATIAVLIVASVMVTVYDDQSAREVLSVEDYAYSLQNEILEEIAGNRTLRLDAMKVVVDLPTDPHYDVLDAYVATKVPDDFGYLLRVCNLGDLNDYCKMPPVIFYETLESDVFVEETVVSAEVGDGDGEEEYSPKKLKLFFWEGGFPEGYCRDECDVNTPSLFCSTDSVQVLKKECGNFDTSDSCNESGTLTTVVESCYGGKVCVDGACVVPPFTKLICKGPPLILMDEGVSNFDNECDAFDIADDEGSCGIGKEEYKCWNYTRVTTECLANPVCPSGYTFDSSTPCTPPCVPVWSPLPSTVCAGVSFPQTNQCNSATQQAVGTKNCVASLSARYSNLFYNSADDRWYYDLTISESGGVGVTLMYRQRCWLYVDGCEAFVYDPVAKFGTATLTANGQVFSNGRWFWTNRHPQRMTEVWYGTDANGNAVEVSHSIDTA